MISDHKLQAFLKKGIDNSPYRQKLKGIRLCHESAIPLIAGIKNVAIMANDNPDDSSILGVVKCNSTWACPVCTPRVMAEKGTNIACLIDALKKWENRVAVMVTLTMPHSSTMDCKTSLKILTESWHYLTRNGTHTNKRYYELKLDIDEENHIGGKAAGKKGTIRTHERAQDPFNLFRQKLDIKHFVKVIEFTWGKNSWHPHIHCLLWLPKKNLSKLLDYEEIINKRWQFITKLQTEKLTNKKFTEKLYARSKNHASFTISKNPDNSPRIQNSSMYMAGFSGWGGDNELTKTSTRMKKAAEGHYTPFQLLEEAHQTTDLDKKKKFLDLFIEYAQTTRGVRRFAFSKTKDANCNEIIAKWKLTNDYITAFKKKFMDKAHAPKSLVYWFTEKQWYIICSYQKSSHPDIIPNILKLAVDIPKLEKYLLSISPDLIQLSPINPFFERAIKKCFNSGKVFNAAAG